MGRHETVVSLEAEGQYWTQAGSKGQDGDSEGVCGSSGTTAEKKIQTRPMIFTGKIAARKRRKTKQLPMYMPTYITQTSS